MFFFGFSQVFLCVLRFSQVFCFLVFSSFLVVLRFRKKTQCYRAGGLEFSQTQLSVFQILSILSASADSNFRVSVDFYLVRHNMFIVCAGHASFCLCAFSVYLYYSWFFCFVYMWITWLFEVLVFHFAHGWHFVSAPFIYWGVLRWFSCLLLHLFWFRSLPFVRLPLALTIASSADGSKCS